MPRSSSALDPIATSILNLTSPHWHAMATIADAIHTRHGRHRFDLIERAAHDMWTALTPGPLSVSRLAALMQHHDDGSASLSFPTAPGLPEMSEVVGVGLAVDALDAFWSGAAAGLSTLIPVAQITAMPAARRSWALTFQPRAPHTLADVTADVDDRCDIPAHIATLSAAFLHGCNSRLAALDATLVTTIEG